MSRKSKETNVLELFFNYPSKHWHFFELAKQIKISESKLDKWLKKFQKEELIVRIKKKGQMPYYVANHQHSNYKQRKKIYAHNLLYKSGLLNHLYSLKAKNIILFGSFSRSDWYKDSDIDVFIYGSTRGLDLGKYESILRRDIGIFPAKGKKDLKKMGPALLKNILEGNIIKGKIPDEVLKYACL